MLKEVCGLTVSQIASLLLIEEMTVYQRLRRAKRKIRASGIPLRLPEPPELCSRILLVLQTIYLLFTEGYVRSDGDGLLNEELCDEAIHLARMLVPLVREIEDPGTCRELGIAESLGLLALMRLHHARRNGRLGDDGSLVLLEAQDRSTWDHEEIREATAVLDRGIALRHPGPYQTEAAIAALHCGAGSPEETDWRQIRLLYDRLLEWKPTAVVELNRAVAVGMSEGPEAGLRAAREAGRDGRLSGYAPYHVVLAELAGRAGDREAARESWKQAARLTTNAAERRYVASRYAELG
jgi:RNA polymerase sigma-70 factor (ECF subfamily)